MMYYWQAERAYLVVWIAQFFYVIFCLSVRHTVMFYMTSNSTSSLNITWISEQIENQRQVGSLHSPPHACIHLVYYVYIPTHSVNGVLIIGVTPHRTLTSLAWSLIGERLWASRTYNVRWNYTHAHAHAHTHTHTHQYQKRKLKPLLSNSEELPFPSLPHVLLQHIEHRCEYNIIYIYMHAYTCIHMYVYLNVITGVNTCNCCSGFGRFLSFNLSTCVGDHDLWEASQRSWSPTSMYCTHNTHTPAQVSVSYTRYIPMIIMIYM